MCRFPTRSAVIKTENHTKKKNVLCGDQKKTVNPFCVPNVIMFFHPTEKTKSTYTNNYFLISWRFAIYTLSRYNCTVYGLYNVKKNIKKSYQIVYYNNSSYFFVTAIVCFENVFT